VAFLTSLFYDFREGER